MTSAIVLAAGASSRMGRPKALLPIGGRPAIEVICATLREAGAGDIVVVVGKYAGEIRGAADLRGVRVVENLLWETGRTSSVQAGLAALAPAASATLLALVDMPFVRAETVRTILAAPRATKRRPGVVVPVHGGRRGHPILVFRDLFPRIAALGPDDPLYVVVRAAQCLEVSVDDAGVLVDLDTPQDVDRASGRR